MACGLRFAILCGLVPRPHEPALLSQLGLDGLIEPGGIYNAGYGCLRRRQAAVIPATTAPTSSPRTKAPANSDLPSLNIPYPAS